MKTTRLRIVLAVAALGIATPVLAAAQVRFGVIGGVALGKRDVEHYNFVDPRTGVPSNYYWYPDSAAHLQGGIALEALGRFGGVRASLIYLTAGVVDVTANGKRLLQCGNTLCDDTAKVNPYPGHTAKYVGGDLDLILRGWRADPMEIPFDLYVLVGPGLRRRLNDGGVRDLFEQDDRWTGTLSLGAGFHFAFPEQAPFSVVLLEFRHSRGLASKGEDLNLGSLTLRGPNREAKNILRMGFLF